MVGEEVHLDEVVEVQGAEVNIEAAAETFKSKENWVEINAQSAKAIVTRKPSIRRKKMPILR